MTAHERTSHVAEPPTSYLELVRKFPLYRTPDRAYCDRATQVMDGLFQVALDEGEQAYLDALLVLIEAFESADRIDVSDVTGRDVLAELFGSSGLTQAEFAGKVGIGQSTISAILSGAREMNLDHIKRFATFFGISPAAFLPS